MPVAPSSASMTSAPERENARRSSDRVVSSSSMTRILKSSMRAGDLYPAVSAAELLFAGQRHERDVPAGDHEKRRAAAGFGVVERGDRRVADREELAVALVHVVGESAAVPLAGQRERADDPVAVRLEHDLFLAQVHGPRKASGAGGQAGAGVAACSVRRASRSAGARRAGRERSGGSMSYSVRNSSKQRQVCRRALRPVSTPRWPPRAVSMRTSGEPGSSLATWCTASTGASTSLSPATLSTGTLTSARSMHRSSLSSSVPSASSLTRKKRW